MRFNSSVGSFLAPLTLSVLSLPGQAQTPEVLISQGGTQVYCNAILYDAGGPDGNYSNNEDFTITFCPGTPGNVLQFSLSTLLLGGAGDVLAIYSGTVASGTPLGATNDPGNPLETGLLYTSASPDGCITFRFTSNGSGVAPGWEALLQCQDPCPQPTAYFPPFPESPYKVCPYDTLLIDGSGSSAAPDRTIASYAWSIAGTTTYSSTPDVLLPVPTPGEFPISLVVTDDIGCASTNSSAELVRVGTYPDHTGTSVAPNPICAGGTVTLNGAAQGTLWSSVPEPIISGLFLLPDGSGVTYTSTINVSGFPAGTTINGATDILSICLNMEHSYVGDLIVSMSCPDGQSVLLFNGNNSDDLATYLGSPFDNGGDNGIPGTGAQYCFSMSAPWGTIPEENDNGNWVTAGSPASNSMAPGTYTPQGSFSAWDGCNLNGGWTLSVVDDQGSDDGFIFSMSMQINSALYPDVIEFTPVIGQACDSSFWSGPGMENVSADCDHATVTPPTYGSYDYTYTVTDDFGCTYDTTFHLTVTPGAVFDATSQLVDCGEPFQMGVHFEQPMPQGTITYVWTPPAGLSNTNSAFPQASPTTPTWYHLQAYPAGHPECGMTDSVFVHPITTLEDDSLIAHALCHGEPGSIEVITTGTGGPWDYTWTDGQGNVVQLTPAATGDSFNGPAGLYKVVIREGANGMGCVDSLLAEITQPDPLELTVSPDTTICLTGTATLHAMATGGTDPLQLNWDNGLAPGAYQYVSPTDTTVYLVSVSDLNDCPSDTLATTVNVRAPLAVVLPDTLIVCPEVDTQLFAAMASGGDGAYAFDWGYGPSSDTMQVVNLTASQNICLTLTDGCETPPLSLCTYFDVLPIPELELTADTVLGCAPLHVTFTVKDTTGGATVDWNFGTDASVLAGPVRDFIYSLSGHYDVTATVHWPNGCSDDTTIADMIRIVPVPTADFHWDPDPASILSPTLHFTADAGPWAVDYEWTFMAQDTVIGPTAEHTFPGEVGGSYPVTLRVENYLGCADSSLRLVEVHDEFLVFLPTAFTPDGDGTNDLFAVTGNDIDRTNFDLRVFDRWGREVFATTDPAHPWDGKLNGTAVTSGVYVWKLKARSTYTQNDHELTGHVTVVR